jgi:hemerythrin-like metal-binding protein
VIVLFWNQSLSVKVDRFDDDHKQLFSLLNTLHGAIFERAASAAVQPILDELADYATHHFAAEEALMEETKFPGLSSHRAEHREFVEQLSLIQKERSRIGGQALALAVLLNEWFVEHIVRTDHQYADHLTAIGGA